jgi:hypothetical protein
MRYGWVGRWLVALCLCTSACAGGDDDDDPGMIITSGGAPATGAGGTPAMMATTPPAVGMPPPQGTTAPPVGGGAGSAGNSGAGSPGSGGGAPPIMADAGSDPVMPPDDAGMGMADAATMTAGACGPAAFACRGDAPTAASANGGAKGPYAVESFTSGYRNGPEFADATIWYPTGDAKPPFGCVSVVPGFTAPQASIRNWGPFLASHGIVTITIGTNSTSDPPQARALALMDALVTCNAENERDGPLKGKISKDHNGVSGWSMGGGGTLIAAAANPTLKAGVSFAAWGPSGGAMNKVPVLMFEATADILAASMSDGYYNQTPETTPKMLFEVQGSSHNVANDPANHTGIIGLYGLSWFKVFLEGDERYKQFLTAPKPSITTSKFATNVK